MLQRLLFFLFSASFPFLSAAGPNTGQTLEFIENRGQWDGPFRYKSSNGRSDVYLEDRAFTYVVADPQNIHAIHDYKEGALKTRPTLRFHAYKMVLEGASTPTLQGSKPGPHYYNYFLGSDPARWGVGIHPVAAVEYTGLYAGVDARVTSEDGNPKYEFTVAPGADPGQIVLRYEGADGVSLKDGRLRIQTSVGTVEEAAPFVYQYVDGQRVTVPCRYRLEALRVGFDFPQGYDEAVPLVIDPTIVFATFTGSTADNWGFTATYDDSGAFYAGGIVSGTGYPTTTGAFQGVYGGGGTSGSGFFACDMSLSKFNAAGTALLWSSYLGGSDNEQPHSLFVDSAGNLVVAGRTYSTNFPMLTAAYDNTPNGGADLAIVKVNPTGTALVATTFLGGSSDDGVNVTAAFTVSGIKHNYGDDARSEVICDRAGKVYVAAPTKSSNFPTVNAAQATYGGGGQDGIVAKLNYNLTTLEWSTFVGGTSDDAAYVLVLDSLQTHVFVAGGTQSSNFPMPTGGLNPAYLGGTVDGFILKYFNGGTYPRQRGTFLGTTSYDQAFGVQVDLENSVYTMGQTLGGTFPVSSGVYSNAGSSQFVIKLDSNLTSNVYSTVFGSGTTSGVNISPVAFLVDTCQNVYISGWGGDLTGNNPNSIGTTGLPVTTDAAQPSTDGDDFYFFVLSKNAVSLLYASFFGGVQPPGSGEHVDGGTSRFSKSGVVYQAICGGCGGFSTIPTTPGVWSPTNASPNCNLTAVKIAFNLGAVNADAVASPSARGCPPLTVNFTNGSTNALTYEWVFGDGGTSTLPTPTHVYTTPGTFTARLIAINPNACKVRDTVYLTIIVDTNRIAPAFAVDVLDSCGPYRIGVTNTSTLSSTPGAAAITTYTWLWGDGSSSTSSSPGIHDYADTGTYTVKLIMRDTTACNSPDTVEQTVRLTGRLVKAGFVMPDTLCIGTDVVFTNASTNATGLLWRFGDGGTSTATSPLHTYATTGTYTVTQVATNPATCNGIDSTVRTVVIRAAPIADFTHAPVIPVANMPIDFTNRSKNAVSYQWGFGDGTGSTDVNPSHFYRRTGSYTVCLIARSADGCTDTACRRVEAEIHPAADVPTGFSPNGDGSNDVLYVRGAAIETVHLRIFNRWGELVFETTSMNFGWDGAWRGKPAEMDAYAFVLNVTFVDGTALQKTGNVTLLR